MNRRGFLLPVLVVLGVASCRAAPPSVELVRERAQTTRSLAGLDLRGLDLSGFDLRAVDLGGADLRGARLDRAELTQANLGKADLRSASLVRASLRGTVLEEADLRKANLDGADLTGARLSEANLEQARLVGASLGQAELRDANLVRANLLDADLSGADLREADVEEAILAGAVLRGTTLSKAQLERADLSRADLRQASLREADLTGARLDGADLTGADLQSADLENASFLGASLADANLFDATVPGTKFAGARFAATSRATAFPREALSFLAVGTVREEVAWRLDRPAAEFDEGRIAVYRLVSHKGLLVSLYRRGGVPPGSAEEYSLVLLFDPAGRLRRHTLRSTRTLLEEGAPAGSSSLTDRLAFLVDGSTSQEEVLVGLGLPSAEFEGERILTYRVGTGARGTVIAPRHAGDWQSVQYSLVLVFDDQRVLRRHALVKVD